MTNEALTYLCFDFGVKRFGVACGNSLLKTASELAPIKAREGIPDWEVIEQLVEEWKPTGFVVGLPLNMDGSESDMSLRAKKFGKRLKGRFNKPVDMMDERLSSFEAKQAVKARTGRYVDFGDHSVDGAAACLILESWFAAMSDNKGTDNA
ncbi:MULTISPECIES: Holliday junction resolvase RuvX [unclassified Oleiphilus]|jgi:putative Holliday junction resolvase|uniref:Holliday junction resolvase RuvX n=2 Tax=Oleiphilus TaxID=141450 RepID=UPI0007C2D164|nr:MULTISPECIES: Holliday junction resolvase RuvX [unclassified Oleiphilus]KZY42858.1 crossover junction endodeoxyribonuclease RuvA [Oleiphilus sp. HI0050]KZY73785.1 crossover junction endodeoxyribonuclease RuvA [Oleiphilus sp. HI0068]KZY85294.1 crossover junction endodeoxyribonuclease RuvA [Oleiphilus sp. HI0069]KZZ09913.1 crossover junction endodeoxyribonuclease RuvA [Oleiphilus sp. HI0078]KZZ29778.1 crossover junction endodeoxyribonuclease RuvA [Oleiphilus sp. HI0081]KZZ40333.1 crossover j